MLKEKFKKHRNPILLFLMASFATHLAIYLILNFYPEHSPKKPTESVEFEYIEAPKKRRKQIVQQDQRINDEVPEKAKYLSKHDQTVKKETKAAKSGEFKNTPKPGQAVAGQKAAPKKQAPQKRPKPGKAKSLQNLIPKYSLTPQARKELAQHVGNPSQTDDYLKDVEQGLQTALSTREFLYYSYYDRIKRKIRRFWEPGVRQKVKMIYRKGRTIASSRDRITQVLITLDSSGGLERIEVITQSGVHALDEAAIDAFKKAAPFPNPPTGMVEKDGRIRIRWDFILEASLIPRAADSYYARLAR